MFAVFKVKQGPELRIAAKDYMASASAIATIGTSFGCGTVAVKMHRSGASFTRTAANFNVIDEIGFCHGMLGIKPQKNEKIPAGGAGISNWMR
jgi:hypothetical protein